MHHMTKSRFIELLMLIVINKIGLLKLLRKPINEELLMPNANENDVLKKLLKRPIDENQMIEHIRNEEQLILGSARETLTSIRRRKMQI